MKQQALVALALAAACVAVALIARAERVYSVADVRSAFASEGLRLRRPGPVGLLPPCPPAWSRHRWGFWTAPTGTCLQAVLATGSGSAVVYLFPSAWDAARFFDPRWTRDYELVGQRGNVMVLVRDWHPSLAKALDALESSGA